MKYLFFISFSLFTLTISGQTNRLNEVQKLIESFETKQDPSLITESQELMDAYFKENEMATSEPLALKSKAQVLTLALANLDQEKPFENCTEIQETYATALAADKSMFYRNQLLNELYTSKIAMMTKGNKAYEEKNNEDAYQYYVNSLKLNDLEIAHPRHATLDTSLYYTSAVFARLSGREKEAAKIWEELIDMEYPRPDMYDNLIRYYGDKKREKDVERIAKLKAARYP